MGNQPLERIHTPLQALGDLSPRGGKGSSRTWQRERRALPFKASQSRAVLLGNMHGLPW